MKKHPYFEMIRARYREKMQSDIPENCGERFQELLSIAEDELRKPDVADLIRSIVTLSSDPRATPIRIDHHSAGVLRRALEAVLTGCDARLRASIAADDARQSKPNDRARAWADAFGMSTSNLLTKSNNRTAINHLLAYVQYLYEHTGDDVDATRCSREDRLRAVDYVRRSFQLPSQNAAIQSLIDARKNPFVIKIWPNELLPVRKIQIPAKTPKLARV